MLFGKKKAIFVSMNKEEMISLQNALNIGCDCIKENGMTDVGYFAADNNDLITQSGNIIPQTSIEEIER